MKLKYILIYISIFILFGCTNNSNINLENNNSKSEILNLIEIGDLDKAGEKYIETKDDSNLSLQKDIATKLALAHMKKGENILANFYIQEAILSDPSDQYLKYLLVKNQYIAAKNNSNDLSYIKKALDAIETNIMMISDYDYSVKANKLKSEIKMLLAKRNKEIANYYKRIRKENAANIYENKAQELGFQENSYNNNLNQ